MSFNPLVRIVQNVSSNVFLWSKTEQKMHQEPFIIKNLDSHHTLNYKLK